MHGESTQALSGQQAVQAGRMQMPVTEAPGSAEAFESSTSDGGANKGRSCSEDCQTRSDCHSAVVRNPASKRVHGYQGTMLKRLAVPKYQSQTGEQSTNAALVNHVVADLHAREGARGAEQGRSRHRTITPVWGAKPSGGPHFKVPRATSICRRLQGITRVHRPIPFHFTMAAMHITADHGPRDSDIALSLSLSLSLSSTLDSLSASAVTR
ncbi:hypothetical protein HBI56_184260 [Parastagonospora nodorum]|uniref:Uncharacterized protein n=2 Tax=Phaeosphaeria nodorum (strain SN15 / ATCC MYA-4574 / FGSC 10173) TaxID=321614 RepID=A0A7U2FHB0_PHANO|nr:hypothetical protein SNOG_14215 [Parastagonospora nodorum SN15]KAH3907284.1 hypothetical protein HBH56_192730 [Parastagonospora nodorum]EAT78452.1 hypothetical protein SNOG_14215 [Parastagonospora nodorum SN15]KAH3938262.1 hypothetical protein HBH54_009230 [Parastagonospora nodorum]KAH3940808.1 hypothetical protein HBH53_213070 [Parastagonospora nodorum]KAH3966499.1 hypothetical protein HBH52_198190 [Parastagonospora nodorum]